MLIEKVLNNSQIYLKNQTIRDAVIGISLIAIELDNGNIGVSYVLRERLGAGCSIFPYGQQIIGKDAYEVAKWVLNGIDELQKGIGMAVLCAASQSQTLEDSESLEKPFGVSLKKTDRLGMIGYIKPVAKILESHVKEMFIFDKGISQKGFSLDVLPMEKQKQLLPICDIVFISGTTMINGTIDQLLEICKNAREIIMIGASTPMYPKAFIQTNITVLAGSWWKKQNKEEIFKTISLSGGISDLRNYVIKKSVRV